MSYSRPSSSIKIYQHEYKVKLIGLQPIGFEPLENSERWEVTQLPTCKRPAQLTHLGGQLNLKAHPSLADTAVVERRHGIGLKIPTVQDSTSGSIEANENSLDDTKDSPILRTIDPPRVRIPGNFDHAATNFVHDFFDSSEDKVPDFICDRQIPLLLATGNEPVAIEAKKIKFSPGNSEPFTSIQLTVPRPGKNDGNTWIGYFFPKRPARSETTPSRRNSTQNNSTHGTSNNSNNGGQMSGGGTTSTSLNSNELSRDQSQFANSHHAFLQSRITRKEKALFNDQLITKGFNLTMSAPISGVWNLEAEPQNYSCAHLAEIRSAMEDTVSPLVPGGSTNGNSFYKRMRMKSNYWQSYLAGEKNYLVEITQSPPPGVAADIFQRMSKVIKEIRLYDVNEIPHAIHIAAQQEGFPSWSNEELERNLFNSLQLIHETMKGAREDVVFSFIKYNEGEPLIYDPYGKLHREILLSKTSVLIYNLPVLPVTWRLPSHEEVKKHDENLLTTILKSIVWPNRTPLPGIRKRDEGGMEVNLYGPLELRFWSVPMANNFMRMVRTFWRTKENLPLGFEGLWINSKYADKGRDGRRPRSVNEFSNIVPLQVPYPDNNFVYLESAGAYGLDGNWRG